MKKQQAVVLGACLALSVAGATACRSARASTPVERPNLEVPPPPPRVIEPAQAVEPIVPEPIGELPAAPPSGGAPRPRPPREPGTAKPEAKLETPAESSSSTPAPVPVPPQLRAPGLASGPETARDIRALLARATAMLARIDYSRLSKTRQSSYDTAKRFAEEGEKELKAANYVLAKELAEKAERLARELQAR